MDPVLIGLGVAFVLLAGLAATLHVRASRRKRLHGDGARGQLSGGGLVMMAQVNGPAGMPEPKGDTIEFMPDGEERITYGCGHEGATKGRYVVYGEEFTMDFERMHAGAERCPECIVGEMRKDIIRCALCGHFILPGQAVAVYGGGCELKQKWSTRTPDGGYIGCMRWDCCPSGGFYAGHWFGRDGFRPAFRHGCAAAEAMATGKPVFGNTGPVDDED